MIQNSAYDVYMGKSDFKVLCRQELNRAKALLFHKRIKEDYRAHLILDNLPAATKMIREMPDGKTITMYDRGYPLGFIGSKDRPGTVAEQAVHQQPPALHRQVPQGGVVRRLAHRRLRGRAALGEAPVQGHVDHRHGRRSADERARRPRPAAAADRGPEAGTAEVIFTYDVKWEYSDIKWASRWDLYLYMGDDQIHWFSIINSLAIVLLLTGIVAMIMMRTLRRDFNRYNARRRSNSPRSSGWKLVHAMSCDGRPGRCSHVRHRTSTLTLPPAAIRSILLCCSPGTAARSCSPSSMSADLASSARCSASSRPPTAAGCSPRRCCSSS